MVEQQILELRGTQAGIHFTLHDKLFNLMSEMNKAVLGI